MKMQPQPQEPIVTWVHDIFQGKLVNETRCLQVRAGACYTAVPANADRYEFVSTHQCRLTIEHKLQ